MFPLFVYPVPDQKKEKEKKSMKGSDQGRKPLSHKVVSGAVKLTGYAQKSALVHVSESTLMEHC